MTKCKIQVRYRIVNEQQWKNGCMGFKDALCLWLVVWGVFSWPDPQSFLKLSGKLYRKENPGRAAEI